MFEIFTDSSCNLSEKLIKKYDIKVASFTYTYEGEEFLCYEKGRSFDYDGFYAALRSKQHLKTSMVNSSTFYHLFKPFAKSGSPLLYIGMSSSLSGTYNAAKEAMAMLKEEYPETEMTAIDSLSGSYGEGLLCYYAAKMREKGADFASTSARIESLVPLLRSRFTCNDLFYVKRGGRISSTVALAGTLMGIKPMLRTDKNGKIDMYDKVRGRKNALDRLVDELERSVDLAKHQIVAISHADCDEDAKYLCQKLSKLPYISDVLCEKMEPVTSIHGGPGMIALFYIAREPQAD